MRMKLKQLFFDVPNENNDYVSYENQLKTRRIFNSDELENLFYEHYDFIMAIVEAVITDYINCEELCNDDEDMFPKKRFLTGEWYVSETDFEDTDYLAVRTAFIGTDLGYKDDYFGLEVILHYDKETEEFIFDEANGHTL